MVNCVLKKLNCKREDAVIVGDRLYTDIKQEQMPRWIPSACFPVKLLWKIFCREK